MEATFDIHQLLSIARRRMAYFVVPAVLLSLIGIAVALLLPSKYKSTATILIEAQGIPEQLVQTTVTGYIEQRLQTLSQIVLARQNVLDLINQFDLYRGDRRLMTSEELIDKMRKNVLMDTIQADVGSGAPSPGKGSATVAFTISYIGETPTKTLQVANKLASLYLEENLKSRTAKAKSAVDFLVQQADELKDRIAKMESRIADFKEKNFHSLPELLPTNLASIERLEREVESRRDNLRALTDRQVYLEGQLASVEPQYGGQVGVLGGSGPLMRPDDQVEYLRNQYLQLKASLSEKHPDVIRLKKQLDELGAGDAGESDLRQKSKELEAKERELQDLRGKYSDTYPDVVRLKKEVQGLRAEIATHKDSSKAISDYQATKPSNPAYITLQTQIKSGQIEMEKEKSTIADLERKARDARERLDIAPKVEEEYNALMRDYQTSQTLYRDTLAKLQSARSAKDLEEENISERLTIIDAPQLPEQAFKPNRPLLMALSVVLGLGAGVGVVILTEFMDNSIRTTNELKNLAAAPLLAVVPPIITSRDIARKRRRKLLIIACCVGVVVLLLVGVHVLYTPLDVLWFQALRRFGIG